MIMPGQCTLYILDQDPSGTELVGNWNPDLICSLQKILFRKLKKVINKGKTVPKTLFYVC